MKAFHGVRIIEFAQLISGPFATELFALLGADVIKIESPGDGDQARGLMDTGPLAEARMAPLFTGMNAAKRSIAMDLKRPESREVVHRLVASANAVIENYRPGAMKRLGFSYDDLREVRPSLVYCSVSGFGQSGPRRDAPAYDGAIQAASGMMSVTGNEADGPMKVGFAVVDVATALTAAFALSSALYRQAQTGEGQYLDVSMLDTSLWLMSPLVTNFVGIGELPAQMGNSSLTRLPTANTFPTADGYLQITAVTAPQLRALWQAVGRPEVAADPRYATPELQLRHWDELRGHLVAALSARPAAEWEPALNDAGVPASRVLTIPEALSDPQSRHRDPLLHFAANEGVPETVAVNAGFRASSDGPGTDIPSPRVGQHTGEILSELGYGPDEIEALRAAGAV